MEKKEYDLGEVVQDLDLLNQISEALEYKFQDICLSNGWDYETTDYVPRVIVSYNIIKENPND